MTNRNNLLQRISDGFLPKSLTKILYKTMYKVVDTDINGWSIVHLLSGLFIGLVVIYYSNLNFKVKIYVLLGIHTIWEIFQFIAGDNQFDFESFLDILFDTIFFMIGGLITF